MDGPKRQQRAEATRRHLLAAAHTVFVARGYHGASVAAITDEAATAHGTFYLYFKNKEDVFSEVMTEMLDELYRHSFTPLDEIGGQFDPTRIRDRIAAFLGVFAAEGRLWRALLEAVLASPAIEREWVAQRARFTEGVAERLRVYQQHSGLPVGDASEVAYVLGGMLEWYAFTGVAFDVPRPLAATDEVIDLITGTWTRALGLGSDPAGPVPAA